jgi:hypothetical protein
MKFSATIICILMICVMGVSAQRISDLPKARSFQASNQTSVVFEKTTHDYGTMVQGADGNCEFRFTNTGKAPLTLSNVTASCGCTVPEWPNGPIAPGTSSSIKVKYNTVIVGVFNKSITVNSNAVTNPIVLYVKGNVSAPKTQAPHIKNTTATTPPTQKAQPSSQDSIKFEKTIHDYGTLVKGADGNCEFKFTNPGKVPLILSNVQASCGCTIADWPKEPILPEKSGSIKVKYNTDLPGAFTKSITVNSNALNNTVVLQIKGNVTIPQKL